MEETKPIGKVESTEEEKIVREIEEESSIDNFKKDYDKVRVVYELPEFDDLNSDFGIEKIADIETEFLVREIRKYMSDKFSSYLRLLDGILHPVGAQMFVFSIVKAITNGEKEKLVKVYKKLTFFEIDLLELDLQFDEKKEAKFILESFNSWQEMKKDLLGAFAIVKKNMGSELETNVKSKGYFN